LADFEHWAAHAGEALGWTVAEFQELLEHHRRESTFSFCDRELVAALTTLADEGWEGTTSALMGELRKLDATWDFRNVNGLSRALNRAKPVLRNCGVEVHRPGRTGKARLLVLRKHPQEPNRLVAADKVIQDDPAK
jgi:hypothetical protein